MSKSPTPPPASPPASQKTGLAADETEARRKRFGVALLEFLTQYDPAIIGVHLAEDPESGFGLTVALKRRVELAEIKFSSYCKEGHHALQAEEMAMKEVIRPESQIGGPMLPDMERKQIMERLAAWKKTPQARPYLP